MEQDEGVYLDMLKEPAMKERVENGKSYAEQKLKGLENYLVHIFDQPVEKAYRRNMGFWGKQYLDRKRKESNILERYDCIKKV